MAPTTGWYYIAMGRPTDYALDMAHMICERIATGEDGLEQVLADIRREAGWAPDTTTVWRWQKAHPEFQTMIDEARAMQGQLLHDRAQVYAREANIGLIERVEDGPDGHKTIRIKQDNVDRSRLLVSTTLKRAGQLNPKYGDKIKVEDRSTDRLNELLEAMKAGPVPVGGVNPDAE